jgi:hypothetical protein
VHENSQCCFEAQTCIQTDGQTDKDEWKDRMYLFVMNLFHALCTNVSFLLSLAPQLTLGLGLLHKIRLNFLEASQQISFYRVGLLAPRPIPIPEDQASVFISPKGRVATHFSRLLRHAWVTMGLFLYSPVTTRGKFSMFIVIYYLLLLEYIICI